MTYEKNSLLSRGAVSEGAVSISLNDSWTGRKLLEALGNLPPKRFSPEEFDVCFLCLGFEMIYTRAIIIV